MADIFQEVDEDLKRDQYLDLWQKYGRYAIAAAVGVVAITAAIVFWRDYQAGEQMDQSRRYEAAMTLAQDGKTQDALAAFNDVAADSGASYTALASLQEGALRAREGDLAGAAAAYGRVADDGGADDILQDLATLLFVLYSLDTGEPAALTERLQPLTEEDNPWRFSARELDAFIAIKSGDTARAREIFTQLGDDQLAPQALRGRATEMLSIIGK